MGEWNVEIDISDGWAIASSIIQLKFSILPNTIDVGSDMVRIFK